MLFQHHIDKDKPTYRTNILTPLHLYYKIHFWGSLYLIFKIYNFVETMWMYFLTALIFSSEKDENIL